MITFIIEWNMYTKFPDFGVHFIWKVTPGWSWSSPHLPPPHHPRGTSYLASSDLAFALWSEEDSYGIMFCFCFWRFSQGGKWFIALSSFSGHFDPFRTCEKEFRIFNIDVPPDFPELFRVFFFSTPPYTNMYGFASIFTWTLISEKEHQTRFSHRGCWSSPVRIMPENIKDYFGEDIVCWNQFKPELKSDC